MNGGRMKRFLNRATVMCGMALVLLVLVLWKIPCLFRKLTTLPCPTCGMSRAWLSFFRLDIAGAFRYHPMFWGLPLLGLLYLLDGCPFPGKRRTQALYVLILLGFFITYCIRLVYFLSGGNVV